MSPDHYRLGQLITALTECDPNQTVAFGFGNPHSYRGYYDELAFEPVQDTTVGAMLAAAREAQDSMYHGYKGGEYVMDDYTPCWLASYGCTGETLGATMLALMLGQPLDTPTK